MSGAISRILVFDPEPGPDQTVNKLPNRTFLMETGDFNLVLFADPTYGRKDKTTFYLGITNNTNLPVDFSVSDIKIRTSKGEDFEILNKENAIDDVKSETDVFKEILDKKKKKAKQGAKQLKNRSSRSAKDVQSAMKVKKSMQADMINDAAGKQSESDKISAEFDKMEKKIEEDEDYALKEIENNYLMDRTYAPGQGTTGFFEFKLPKKLPKDMKMDVKVGKKTYSFSYTIDWKKVK